MILVTDKPKRYRVYQTSIDDEGHQTRKQVGAIPKATMEVPPEIASVLAPEERKELDSQLNLLKEVGKLKLLGALAAFPETVREVVDYVMASGSDAEKQMVATAIFEAVRAIRKHERGEG